MEKTKNTLALQSQIATLIGGILLLAGPFLPWVKAGIFSADGIQKTGGEAYILVGLGALTLASALYSLTTTKNLAWPPIILGILSAIVSTYFLITLVQQISGIRLNISIGIGVFAILIGSIFILLGGVGSIISKNKKKKASK